MTLSFFLAGEAENQLLSIAEGRKPGGKGSAAVAVSGTRKGGSKGKRYGGGPGTADEQLMARLGEILGGNMREDFIVAHMHQPCTFCRGHIRGPNFVYRWGGVGSGRRFGRVGRGALAGVGVLVSLCCGGAGERTPQPKACHH